MRPITLTTRGTRSPRAWLGVLLGASILAAAGCGDDADPLAPGSDASQPATDGGTTPATDGAVSAPEGGASAVCGNGAVEPPEACDGANLGGQTCASLGFAGGTLACKADCTFDPAGCQQPAAGRQFGEKCGGAWGNCATNLTCVLFNESGAQEGYCTAECSDTQPCPSSPPGAECAFKLVSTGKTICGFLCSTSSPTCPTGLACTYSKDGQYYYCSTDPPAKCGNNTVEFNEECDGSDLNNMSCQAFGYSGGTLACDPGCTYDKSGCTGSTTCSNLPPKDCTGGNAYCSKLVPFAPTQGDGYIVTHGQALSWARQDTMMLIKYAAASVACMLPGSYPLGLGDMSMSNGGTPTTSSGQLRHPQNTHVNGQDVDCAYYQVGQPNNYLRPVCPHSLNNQEQYHCVGPPNILDKERSALFLAKLLESDRVRVIGVDGQIGPLVSAQAKQLHAKGMISTASLNAFGGKVAFETTDTGMGWYLFHHHHLHLSTWGTAYSSPMTPPVDPPVALPDSVPWQMPSILPAPDLFLDAVPLDLDQLDRAAEAPQRILGTRASLAD